MPNLWRRSIDEADFCHSCGLRLSQVGKTNGESGEDEESDTWDGLRFIDDATMDDIDYPSNANADGEYHHIMKNEIDKMVKKHELTIDELGAEQFFTHIVVESILERSYRIKLNETKEKSKAIRMAEKMEERNERP